MDTLRIAFSSVVARLPARRWKTPPLLPACAKARPALYISCDPTEENFRLVSPRGHADAVNERGIEEAAAAVSEEEKQIPRARPAPPSRAEVVGRQARAHVAISSVVGIRHRAWWPANKTCSAAVSHGMRTLRDSLVVGVDGGSWPSATAASPALPPVGRATAGQAQTQVTPDGWMSTISACMDLILTVLFCALLILISFHSDRMRRGGRRGGGSAPRRMPEAVYQAEAPGGAECAICLGEFEDGDAVRLLPRCRHGFHVRCIDTWLSTHTFCLTCRDSLLDEGATAGEATVAGQDA